jgi:hypothetical protein
MKKLNWLLWLWILAVGCQEDRLVKENAKSSSDLKTSSSSIEVNCNESNSLDVIVNNVQAGVLSVSASESTIQLDYDLTGNEYFILKDSVWSGDCQAPALVHSDEFTTDEEVREHNIEVDLTNLPKCGCIYVKAQLARFNPISSIIDIFTWEDTIEYCKCEEPDDKNLRTQTQGGWGADPNGNNPGAYLHANFDDAFPNGLIVGCTYTITLSSAQAVTNFLPQGGQAEALTKNYIDPNNTPKDANNPKNVLAGQVVALTLSVAFDLWDEDFGESNTNLADATITTGTFEGWTVAEVLMEAENFLGGCGSTYTASQLNEVLTKINESFNDGTTDTGFLENAN